MDRMLAPPIPFDLVQHRQERRQPRSAGQEEHRPFDLAQVEAAQGPVELDLIPDLGPVPQVGRQDAVLGVPDEEAELVRARSGGERERPGLIRARHRDVHVLAGQEAHRRPVVHLEGEGQRGVGQSVERSKLADVGRDARLRNVRGGRNADNAVRLRRHLAGEDVALLLLVLGHRLVRNVVPELVFTRLAEALARTADPVATVQRDVDALAVRGVGDDLVRPTLDETRDAVLEVQRDLVAHAIPNPLDPPNDQT